MKFSRAVQLVLWGPYGMYTQGTSRADRMTGPPTPAGLAGMVKSIHWHPDARTDKGEASRYDLEIVSYALLAPLQTIRMKVNEHDGVPAFSKRQPFRTALISPVKEKGEKGVVKHRQTSKLVLKDIKLLVTCRYVGFDPDYHPEKEAAQLERKVDRGQCHRRPYFGRQRYPAYFRPATANDVPLAINQDFGPLLWGIEYRGKTQVPHFLKLEARNGVVKVPSWFRHLAGTA